MTRRSLGPAALLGLLLPALAAADDWPQWRGPARDDVSKETGLLKQWPAGGPKLLWTAESCGFGYSGPAVVGDRLYCLGARPGEGEQFTVYAFALDVTTGKPVWTHDLGTYREGNGASYLTGWGGGPRGTPTVDGVSLYALDPIGNLACLETATGKEHWRKNLVTDLRGDIPQWGYSESPLVDGEKLIITPGGGQGTMAALNKATGEVVWRSKTLTDPAAYSSAVVGNAGGVRQYVQLTDRGIAGIAAGDGKQLWYYSKQGVFATAVIPTPIVSGEHVYATAGYSAGCDLLKLTPDGAGGFRPEAVYSNKVMVNQHGGVLLYKDHVYGFSDRKGWVCQNLLTGKAVWEEKTDRAERGLGKGSLTCADGQLYCYGEAKGTLVRVEASPAGWKETGRFTIPRETKLPRRDGLIWTHPVVANGKLYLRDQDLLFCFDLKDASARR
jgi:outer membrane protein assembly factor BamB